MALATLTIDLVAKLATLEQDLGKATRIAEKNAAQMEKAFGRVDKVLKGLFAGFTVNATWRAFVTDVADLGDKLTKLSQRTGLSVEEFQRLNYAAGLAEVGTDDLATNIEKLNKKLGEAKDGSKSALEALGRFGINAGDNALQAFEKIAERVKNTDDIARTSTALDDVFGKQFASLIPLMKSGADGIKAAGDEIERMGGVMSTELAAQSEKLNDDMTRLNESMRALRISVGSYAIPVLGDISAAMAEAAKEGDGLYSVWVGLGGIGSKLFTDFDLSALEKVDKQIAKVRSDIESFNPFSIFGPSLAELKAQLAGLEQQRVRLAAAAAKPPPKAPPSSSGPAITPKIDSTGIDKAQQAYDNLIKSIREKIAVQDAELGITGKIIDAGREYAKFLSDVTTGYLKLTPEQLSKLAPLWYDFLKKAEQLQAKQREIESAAARTQIGDLQEQFGRSNEARSDDMQVMPESQRRLRDALRAVDDQARSTGDSIRNLYAEGKIDAEQYEQLMREINAAIDGQKDRVSELEGLQERLNSSWEHGANRALTAYMDRAANVAQSSEEAFSRAFSGMEDALVEFARTGKLNFRDLADQIIADLIRIQIRAAASQVFKAVDWGSLFNFGGTTTTGGGDAGFTLGFADGGVFKSPSLSRYSGKVYDSPQFFQFANGAGVFGEAGPEAIMPLKRGRNGKLGVASEGGGSNVVVQVIEAPGRGGETNRRSENGTDIIEVMVERIKSSVAADIARGNGAVPASIERAYGVNRVPGMY